MLQLIKIIHVSTVVLSYALFFTRGVWMIRKRQFNHTLPRIQVNV